MSYVDKSYYIDVFKGNMIDENDIDKSLRKASRHIDTLTFNKDMYIIKTNKNGDTLWTRVVNIEGAEQMAGIVETPEKEFMAAFQSGAS